MDSGDIQESNRQTMKKKLKFDLDQPDKRDQTIPISPPKGPEEKYTKSSQPRVDISYTTISSSIHMMTWSD